MKLFSAAVLCVVLVALAAACTTYTKTDTNDEIEEVLPRDKRAICLNKNFEKEVEIKTKSGASIKFSKKFGLKGSNNKNKVGVYQKLKNDHDHGINQGSVSVGSQVNVNAGTSIFGHQGGLIGLLAAKHELLSRKLASIGHLSSHEKLHHDLHGKPSRGLHAFFAAHRAHLARKYSGKMLTAAETKPIRDSCCSTRNCVNQI